MRDLAGELQVNPATVSKAYQRLSDAGVLDVRRGDGTYVAEAPPELSQRERAGRLREAALRFASLAATLGAGRDEALASLERAWGELADGRSGARSGNQGDKG